MIAGTSPIRSASEYFPPGYEPVTVLLRDGRRIPGVRKNEDTFSIQLMDVNEELHLLLKSDLLESSTKSTPSCQTTVSSSSPTPSSTIS